MSRKKSDRSDRNDAALIIGGAALVGAFAASLGLAVRQGVKGKEFKFTVVAKRENLTVASTGTKVNAVEWINDKGETGVTRIPADGKKAWPFQAVEPGKTYKQVVALGKHDITEIKEGPYKASPKSKISFAPKK
jgi:hypothetical protein